MTSASMRPTIAVAVCSYNRNKELANLLDGLLASSAHLDNAAAVGVVVIDDSADGNARNVVERYRDRFELGIDYRISGQQNISIARNLAINTASEMADWIAMIDDDCEPAVEWLEALLETQQRIGVDAVTGLMVRLPPPASPRWLTDEPFLKVGLECFPDDGAMVTTAATHNSMISSRWLKEHPTIRFQPDLGVVGGEDMVFYRAANLAGLRICYSRRAIVYENEPPSRLTLKFQLRSFFWHGNSSYVTNVRNGVSPFRMFLHGANLLQQALIRPIIRMIHGQRPQLRYFLASVFRAIGMMIGPLGIRVRHH
jgi:succinoglycan biosynthesis protein ExoM